MHLIYSSQLYYDGYQQIASSLANSINSHPACPPSDKLNNIVNMGLQIDKGMNIYMSGNEWPFSAIYDFQLQLILLTYVTPLWKYKVNVLKYHMTSRHQERQS